MPLVSRAALAVSAPLLLCLLIACGSGKPATRPTGTAAAPPTAPDTRPALQPTSAKASEELQAKRKAALDKAKANDGIAKLDDQGLWIAYNWHLLEPRAKNAIAAAAWAYIHAVPLEGTTESYPALVIYNNVGGKKIGTYHPSTGLQLDP